MTIQQSFSIPSWLARINIVIEGCHLRPNRVAELDSENIWSAWIVASPVAFGTTTSSKNKPVS